MSRFPRFFTHRAMLLARNDGLICAPISTENDGFFISRRYAIPEYSTGVFAALTAGRGDDFSGLSIYGAPEPNFVFATKDKGSQLLHLQHRNLFAITRRSFACSFNQALNVRAQAPKRPFNPAHTGSFLLNVYSALISIHESFVLICG